MRCARALAPSLAEEQTADPPKKKVNKKAQ